VTDHPIIFSAAMVRALLDGRKTQTRRLAWRWVKDRGERHLSADDANGTHQPSPWQRVQPGDRLWVREAHKRTDTRCDYRVDWHVADHHRFTWRPSIHMPRWASRITLHVEAVRVERLQEITEADARAEGAPADWEPGVARALMQAIAPAAAFSPHATGFARLWNSLHGPGAWDRNEWVAAYTFTVQRGNIDQIGATA
jgi:hypothetical protein